MSVISVAGIRQEMLKKRRALSPDEKSRLSEDASSRFLVRASSRLKGLRVAVYRALPDELDLYFLECELRARGCIVHYPRMVGAKELRQMEFVEVPRPEEESSWQLGPYEIEEPHADLQACDPSKLNLAFVPAVALGESGERIGMGGGYYDRFSEKHPSILRVSIAFDLQLCPFLPQESWDQRIDWIVTEKRECQLEKAKIWLNSK